MHRSYCMHGQALASHASDGACDKLLPHHGHQLLQVVAIQHTLHVVGVCGVLALACSGRVLSLVCRVVVQEQQEAG